MQKKAFGLETRETLVGLSFILPNFIGFAVFILAPVLFSFYLSVNSWDGFRPMEFVGLDNFVQIFKDRVFKRAMVNTLQFSVFTIVFTLVASLALAMMLNQKLKGIAIFRSAIFFPYVASIVAVAVVWNMLFQKDYGPINAFLRFLGMVNPPGWTASTKYALPAVIIVVIWKNMGYYMVIYLAALQGIPPELHEAAMIDGASAIDRFRHVTLPMLTPTTFFTVMMLTINSFKVFDLIYAMTEGGPGQATTLIVNYIYNQAFVSWNYGKASAASMVLFALVATVTIIQFRMEKKWVSYM
ncbi:MAG: sugar ABC transporter permease [Clostridiales bacterium]|nr:sugar ABC transporter permease [Clostridiales bacterium]MDR2749373.1 sugar ABC transporter permease [Clostridiales bacterium]